jgi:S-DNA-T family DNA segregation ATPase FtsK/SpoIIIE
MLELPVYEDLPHLDYPVVTDTKDASDILSWTVGEMERRYQMMNEAGAKNLSQYNQKSENKSPYIIVIIDELADLIFTNPKSVEESIARLSQKARAAGIHMIVATQRPSVDVITGTIKTNFAARIAMRVPSKIDSRTILDANGAESLLGEGDMLFMPPGSSQIQRVHGAFVSETEIHKVVDFWNSQGEPSFDTTIEEWKKKAEAREAGEEELLEDEKYDEAVAIVKESRRASISFVQRRLRIGYNRAARMIERMEREGIVKKSSAKQEWEVAP